MNPSISHCCPLPAALALAVIAAVAACVPAPSATVTPEMPRSNLQVTGFPASCAPDQVQVMLLGTYHFAGSGDDAVRADPADVLSVRRQAELEDLAARLARWEPQQIAVEWPYTFADTTMAWYQRYRAGTLAPARNEVVQIGFRLAHRLGHATVYPIDRQLRLGNDSIAALLERRPELQARSDSLLRILQARTDADVPRRAQTSIIEHLREGNTDAALHGGNSFGMFGSFIGAGEGDNYGGPQLLARWYERNIYMVHNLTRVLRPETRRVLVIVGSGHVPPIRNILDESPQFCPVSALPFLQ